MDRSSVLEDLDNGKPVEIGFFKRKARVSLGAEFGSLAMGTIGFQHAGILRAALVAGHTVHWDFMTVE